MKKINEKETQFEKRRPIAKIFIPLGNLKKENKINF